MTRALVVYESMFGNTRQVAEAIAVGLMSHLAAEVVEVGAAPAGAVDDVGLLVVGGPTHAFGMSRPATRRDAGEQATAPLASPGIGVREWLERLEVTAGVAAATFDTRVDKPRVPGSAAKAAAKRLRRLGARLVDPPTSFFVHGTPGPLLDDELERATRWGEALGARLAAVEREPR